MGTIFLEHRKFACLFHVINSIYEFFIYLFLFLSSFFLFLFFFLFFTPSRLVTFQADNSLFSRQPIETHKSHLLLTNVLWEIDDIFM